LVVCFIHILFVVLSIDPRLFLLDLITIALFVSHLQYKWSSWLLFWLLLLFNTRIGWKKEEKFLCYY